MRSAVRNPNLSTELADLARAWSHNGRRLRNPQLVACGAILLQRLAAHDPELAAELRRSVLIAGREAITR